MKAYYPSKSKMLVRHTEDDNYLATIDSDIDQKILLKLQSPPVGPPEAIKTYLGAGTDPDIKFALIFNIGPMTIGLLDHLEKLNVPYIYLDYEELVGNVTFDYNLTNSGCNFNLILDKNNLNFKNAELVFWNPPFNSNPSKFSMFDKGLVYKKTLRQSLFIRRWLNVLFDLSFILDEKTTWMPARPLKGSQEFQLKVSEFILAKKIGFKVPDWIYTNSSEEIKEFISKYDSVFFREFSDSPYIHQPTFFNNKDLDKFNNCNSSPIFLQEFVKKVGEFRIIISGEECLCFEADTTNSKTANINIKVSDVKNVKWKKSSIDSKLKSKIIKLAKSLNLSFATVDLLISSNGDHYFLEINRPGRCFFLQAYTEVDIPEFLANYIQEKVQRG